MKWRSPRFLIPLSIFCVVLLAGSLLVIYFARSNPPSRTIVPPLPTPGSARTIYANTHFGYDIDYPTQWYLKPLENNSLVRVFMKYDPSVPEAVAFEIRCYPNPNQLDAQTYWQRQQPPSGGETAVGSSTFSSGVTAFVANGQGQTPYTLYTLTHNQIACTILLPETDPANAHVVTSTIDSFRWQ